jgi:ribonuclease HII
VSRLPLGATVRRDAGLYGYERALRRAGMELVAGVDEAGRGACAGPLVAGAAILRPGKSGEIPGLADSKLLTEAARERCYAQVVRRALSWSVVVIESDECDRLGMHVANVEALRRAVALLDVPPEYVLTDGFPVDGLGVPGLAIWKGDRVAACISAASVLAKVTRDRIMVGLDRDHPAYDFKTHKGYITDVHAAALTEHGPCPQHRMRFVNVRRAAGLEPLPDASPEERDPSVAGCPEEASDEPSRRDLVDSTSVGIGTSPRGQPGERGETA